VTYLWDPRGHRGAPPRVPGVPEQAEKEPYIGCVWFSLAYALTGSPLGSMIGHMGTHDAMLTHGFVVPPHQEAKPVAEPPQEQLAAA
jgi:hypothetical protein